MKTIYKRVISIVCTVLMIIPILVLPANANYYGVTCTQEDHEGYGKSQYSCRTCLLIAEWLPSNQDLPDSSVEDSYCIPEDDVVAERIKKDLDKHSEAYPENYDESPTMMGFKHEIYFRIFSGPVINGFYTAGTHNGQLNIGTPSHLHRIISMCNKVYYTGKTYLSYYVRDENGEFVLKDDGSLENEEVILYDESRFYINPVNNRISQIGGQDSVGRFLEDPEAALTSAEATKQLADKIEIEHTFAFVDNSAGIIYCVTNEGDYVYFSSANDDKKFPPLVLPAERFKKMLNELTGRYAESKGVMPEQAWSAVLTNLQSENNIAFVINYHSKDEILPYVSGGDAAVMNAGISDDDYGKALIKDNSNDTHKKAEENSANIPVDANDSNEPVFTVLFIVETALVVVGGAAALITVLVSRARRKKEKHSTDE